MLYLYTIIRFQENQNHGKLHHLNDSHHQDVAPTSSMYEGGALVTRDRQQHLVKLLKSNNLAAGGGDSSNDSGGCYISKQAIDNADVLIRNEALLHDIVLFYRAKKELLEHVVNTMTLGSNSSSSSSSSSSNTSSSTSGSSSFTISSGSSGKKWNWIACMMLTCVSFLLQNIHATSFTDHVCDLEKECEVCKIIKTTW